MIVQADKQRQERIADRLAGAEILVTGATGFLAKVFVEKILRAIPNIGKVHLLVRRASDGASAEERVRREVIGSNAFDRLRAAWGPAFEQRCSERIQTIEGDITRERFGLSEEDYRKLASQVTIVVNSAATVTFDERLDAALTLNIDGPRRLLQFASDAGNAPLMQVSTAYVSGVQTGDIPEELVPPGHTVASYIGLRNGYAAAEASFDLDETLASLRETVDRVQAEFAEDKSALRAALIDAGMKHAQQHGWNDTYTCTKWMAEQFLARDRGNVPLVLFRPAIIEGSYDEPAPGWIDGLRMADPLILAYGRGKLTEFPADEGIALDLIPVDFVANAMVATLPVKGNRSSLEVYHCSSGSRNPVYIHQITAGVKEAFRRRPMRSAAGAPIRVSKLTLIPREQFVRRWKARLHRAQRLRRVLRSLKIMTKYRRRIAAAEAQIAQLIYFVKIYSPYTHLNCRYRDDHLRAVYDRMPAEDRDQFPFDVARIDWRDYLVHRHVPGVRHFVLGAGMELEAPMLAANYAVAGEDPEAPPPMKVLAALRGESIFDVFANAAKAYPARIALQTRRGGRWIRYTYAEALATTAAIARRFEEFGLNRGDHIAICGANSPEWSLTYLSAMRSGLTVVPLDVQLSSDDHVAMSRFADVKLVCAESAMVGKLREASERATSESGVAPLRVAPMDGKFVPPPGTARDSGPAPAVVRGDDVASIVFTSGTTVAPKGVMLLHRNFLANARSLVHAQPVHADDQFLSVLPMHHVFEFTGGFLVPMANASTVTYVEHLNATEITSTMQATGTTVMMVVPRLLKLFHDGIERGARESGAVTRVMFRIFGWLGSRLGADVAKAMFGKVHKRFGGRVRMFVCGGSALPESLYHGFSKMGFPVYEGYGLTETAPVLTVNPAGASRAGAVGLPLPEVELDIRNQDASGVGELWVKGPNVMAGYYKNDTATADVLQDGWFRTGDLCRRDADGFLYVTGRAKDVIITSAGKNVYPEEVAEHYANLPRVKEMVVLGMPTADGIGETVDAVMVLDLEGVADVDRSAIEEEVRNAAAKVSDRIPSYQQIQNIHFWTDELPRTTTLKVKRSEVARMIQLRERPAPRSGVVSLDDDSAVDAPTRNRLSGNARWVNETLARMTRREADAIEPGHHLLLDLGVDSLMKLELLGEIDACFGIELTDEVSNRIGRVSDLISLIGRRERVDGKGASGRNGAWRERLKKAPSKSSGRSGGSGNGRIATPLLPLRWAFRTGVGAFFHSYIRVECHGTENLPKSGGFILAANHASHLDSGSVVTALAPALRRSRRRCYIAGAQDYFFNNPFKATIFRDCFDTIPFDRHSDGLEGLRRCGDALRRGQAVLIFPEGTRSLSGEIQQFKIGFAVLAVEVGAPIVPVRIVNAFDLMPKGRRIARPGVIEAHFGTPVMPEKIEADGFDDRYAQYRALAESVQRSVESLGEGGPG